MHKFHKLIQEANQAFKTADHLTYITYPLIKDTKLIMNIAESIYLALFNSMNALLRYDQMYKRISTVPENFHSRLDVFKHTSAPRYKVDKSIIDLLQFLQETREARKKSRMEFIRDEKYVIYHNSMQVKTFTLDQIKTYLQQTRSMLHIVNKLAEEHVRQFR